MTVRPATLADLLGLRLLLGQLLQERGSVYPLYDQTDLERFTVTTAGRLGMDPRLVCWVAEEEQLVGFGFVEIYDRPVGQPSRYGVVLWLYVHPVYRGQGLARQICAGGLAELQQKGCGAVELVAQVGDEQWSRRGWVPVVVTHALPISQIPLTLTPHGPANGHAEATE